MKHRQTLFAAAGLFLLAAPLRAGDLAKVRASGKLRVLTDLSDPNDVSRLLFRNGPSYDGVEYEILQSFASTLNVKVEITVVPRFDEIFADLASGRGDVAAASITDTAERRRVVDLSDSYFPVREAVIVRKDSAAASFPDLAGRTAVTQPGTTWETDCRKAPRVRLVETEKQADLFAKVADGTADFTVTDTPMALTYLERFPDLKIAWTLAETHNYAFALPRGSELTAALNSHLARLKSSGTYYALLARFYGNKGLALIRASEPGDAQKR